jgi:ketopantoate reductase
MFGNNFFTALIDFCGVSDNGLMSLVMAIVIIAIMRKLDGMFEDQKAYLMRLDKEKRDMMRHDEFGDEPIEIDEESLAILNKGDNDLY